MNEPTPPRPKQHDSAIVLEAAQQLAPKVKEWCGDGDADLDDIVADLVKVLKWESDGYQLAKDLDGQYDPDAALVEILDEAGWIKHRALENAEEEWVKANSIQPIPLGTKVTWPKMGAEIGVVGKNYPSGKAVVAFASLGHASGSGYIVEWEKLTVVA